MKQTTKIVLISVGIVLLLAMIGFGIYYFGFSGQAVVQVGDYTCPSGYKCVVTPILECTQEATTQKVVFRTNAINGDYSTSNRWIAWDIDGDGNLNCFSVHSNPSPSCNINIQNAIQLPSILGGNKYYGNVQSIFEKKEEVSYNYCAVSDTRLLAGTGCEVSSTPTEPYKTNSQEIYEGNAKLYSCSRNIYIDGSKQEALSWSSDSPTPTGGITGKTYTLSPEQKITSTGTGVFKIKYENSVYTPPVTTCTAENGDVLQAGQSICLDKYTAQKCVEPPNTEKTYAQEGQLCKDGIIAKAYTVTVNIDRNVISYGEKFEIDFTLKDTDNNKNIEVTASLLKGSQTMASVSQLTGNTPFDAGKTHFSLDSPPIGYYTLRITFNNADGTYKADYNVQVTDSLSLILKTPNTIQFDNEPIVISLESYKSGSYKALTNYQLDATYNGRTVYQKTTQSGGLGILKFYYDLDGDGILRVRAKGNDETGLWTEWTDYLEVTVKKSYILISALDFPSDVCVGSHKLEFETKDSTGNYIETSNQITIDKPLGGTDSVSATGSNGKYSFTYNFVNGGAYVVRITSTNTNIGTSQLNGGEGQIVNILTGDACGSGGDGGINWTVYLIIGVAVLGVIFFVYFVFFYKRQK